jgi:hypothetical protein
MLFAQAAHRNLMLFAQAAHRNLMLFAQAAHRKSNGINTTSSSSVPAALDCAP